MAASIPGWRPSSFSYQPGSGVQKSDLDGNLPSWNALILNGERMPGLAIWVSGPDHKLVAFSGRAAGRTPGAATVRGREPALMVVQLILRTNFEWELFVALQPRLLPIVTGAPVKAGTAVVSSTPQGALPPGAIQISYPLAQAFGVRFAIVKEIKPAAPKGGGPVVITIVFEEVQQAKKQQSKQANPKATGLEGAASTIEIAGEAPRPPALRDFARKPVAGAR